MTCLTAVIHSLGQLGQPILLLMAAEHPVLGEGFEAVGRQADITLLHTSSELVFLFLVTVFWSKTTMQEMIKMEKAQKTTINTKREKA